MADRLTAFLYVLMRDHVPSGTVKSLLNDVAGDEFDLSAPELEALALRYSMPLRVPAADENDEEFVTGEGADGHVQQIERDQQGVLQPVEGDGFSPEMGAWLDMFDDRIEGSPHFVEAVNEAAANEMVADEVAGRLVAQRVHELREAQAKRDADAADPDHETDREEG